LATQQVLAVQQASRTERRGIQARAWNCRQTLLPDIPSLDLSPNAWNLSLLALFAGIRAGVEIMRRRNKYEWTGGNGAVLDAPLPPLEPFARCQCGGCRECLDNQKWDRIFAKFEVKQHWDSTGIFRSALHDL
jgi:hypothetical protein